jgi:hypothetical protein
LRGRPVHVHQLPVGRRNFDAHLSAGPDPQQAVLRVRIVADSQKGVFWYSSGMVLEA